MKKKLLALFLCCALSFGLVTAALITPASADTDFMVYQKGAPVTAVELPENGSVAVEALLNASASGSFQWQIMARGVWANVIGATGSSLTLRYAMLANVLNGDGQASVRCRFTPLGAEAMYSNTVTVQMIPDSAATVPEDDAGFDFTVLDPGSVVEHETAAPADETPAAPTENTAPAGDAAIASNGAATGYALVPPAEPVPAGDTEVPSDEPAPAGYALVPPEEPAPANDPPAEDTPSTYSVVVTYQFEDSTPVAEPYTASIAAGSAFSATVTFPTVQGYLPYVNETQQNSLDLNYTAIDKDYTYNVVYKPTNVSYTVIHYQQNVDNDNYTEVERDTTQQGLTGSQVPEVAKKYEGFYSLKYEQPNIAADGSTVIEVYYDRYYFLMLFDMDGGYGTDPIYVRYGASLGTVNEPTKAGYNFDGWALTKDGAKVELPATMPAENRTYYALWTPDATAKVTVVFWGENADDEEYSYLDGYTKTIDLEPGTEFTYTENGMLTCTIEEHTHNAECYSCGHAAGHGLSLDCYGITSNPVDPNNGFGDNDARTHFEGKCDNTEWFQYTCKGLDQYLKDGSVCQYTDGTGGGSYNYYYFLYFGGNYYSITKSQYDSWKSSTGKSVTHGRDTYYVYEGNGCPHVHIAACYSCGKTEHTHNSGCYAQGAGLDGALWEFDHSDTVTVAANGSSVVNVYYDRTEFTLTFRANNNTVATITDKWGADIHTKFPIVGTNGTTYKGTEWKVPNGCQTFTAGTNVLSIDTMPSENITFTKNNTDASATLYYYVESLDGTGTHNYNGKNYDLYKTVYLPNSGRLTESEEFHEIIGFKKGDYYPSTIFDRVSKEMYLYYTRNSFDIVFYNPTELIYTEENVPYQKNLSSYVYTPTPNQAPAKYEPGSVEFEGWYLNPECSGQKFDFSSHTMPAGPTNTNGEVALSLYAKWVPVTHTVKFYLTKDSTDVYKPSNDKEASFTVEHGGNIAKAYVDAHLTKEAMNSADPKPNGDYNFVVWYYYDENGVRKYFDPTMQIRTDLTLYAEWGSDTLKQYTVRYVLQGTDTKVADDLTGSGLAGTTKTFDAKGGTELYAGYQEGYFPLVQSQSLLLDIEAETLIVTFEYVQKDAVPYTVKYLNKETGEPVATEKTVSDNRKAVVTETFVPVPGMMPDAYQKRLVVSAEEGAVNEIIFYYTQDTTHAYYKITHYTENLAKDAQGNTAWTEYASSQAVGDIGTTYTADSMTIPGFTYDANVEGTVTSGELTANGLELKLYYTRNSYPYQVRYLEQGSGKQLANPKNGTGKYGQVVSENAIDITNYTAVAPASQTLNIRIEESQTEAKLNIITFYYTEKEVTINYVVVGPDGCGTVSPASETLKVLTGTAQGSTPTANSGFRFVGWYTDEACTTPVTAGWVDANNKLTPVKAADAPWTNATYYAKFEYDVADLTITKSGCNAADENQCFIFTITGPDGYRQRVVINGNGSVTIQGLKAGTTYTVTEDSGWSWRYKDASGAQAVTLQPGVVNNVAYTNQRNNPKWLGGDAYSRNIFGTLDTVSGN